MKLCINSLNINLKIPIGDQQENINLKITAKSIDFLLKNFENFFDFALTIENFELELKKQENNLILANIFLPNIEINPNEKSIQLNDEIQIYYSLFNIKTIKDLLETISSLKPHNDKNEENEEKENDLNLKISMQTINLFLLHNEQILIKINAITEKINYFINNGNHNIDIKIKIKIEAFYHDSFNLSNVFDFSIENNNEISDCSITNFKFILQNSEIEKELIKINLPELPIKRKENDIYEVKLSETILIYYSLFDTNSIINFIIEIKDIITKEFFIINENKVEDQGILIKLLNLSLKLYLKIQNIDLYLTKSNLPLLLFNSNSIMLQYKVNNQQVKMESKFELIHLCHQNYDVINPFSLVINYLQPDLEFNISSIQTTITSFLIHEILSPEINDPLHLGLDNEIEKIYIKNEIGSDFTIKLMTKNCYDREIDVQVGSHKYITKQKYKPEIKVKINQKHYIFSIYDLYSPIFINENIVVSRKSLNRINTICFSSPYAIHNKLSYDIEVMIDNKNINIINSMNKEFIPIKYNFTLSSQMKASMYSNRNVFCDLDFNSADPIKFHDDSKFLDYYSTYYLHFNNQTSICSIIFEPYITITNYLPFDLSFIIEDIDELKLKPNKPVDISFLHNHEKEFNFILDFGNFAIGNKVISKKKIDIFEEEICLYNSGQKIAKIIFRCSKIIIGIKTIFKMAVFAPLILINDTQIQLCFKESEKSIYQFINNTIFYSTKSLLNNSCEINLPICFQNSTDANSNKFQYVGGFSQVIPLKLNMYEDVYLFLHLKKYLGNYIDSSEIRIRSYLTVQNNTNYKVSFIPTKKNEDNKQNKNDLKNICPGGSRTTILRSYKEGLFDINIDGYQHCKNFNFFTLGCSVIRLVDINDPNTDVLLKLTVKKEDNLNCYCCIISIPELHSHICIKNNLSKNIFIHQHFQEHIEGFKYHSMKIKPNEELIFAKEQPFLDNELKSPYNIEVSFGKEELGHVKFDVDYHSEKIKNLNYYYSVKRNNFDDLNIVIFNKSSNSLIDRTNSQAISRSKTIHYSINLPEFELSYIDKEMHELYLIDIKDTKLEIDNKIKFSIDGFTLNDMYLASLSPVVIHGKETPFLDLEIDSNYPIKNFMFDNIKLKLSPIRAYVDSLFVGDLIASLKEIVFLLSKLQINQKSENNILYKVFSTNSITIEDISFSFSYIDSQDRKYRFKHPDYYNLSRFKLLFFKDLNYTFEQINKYNVEAPLIDFFKSLLEDYKNQLSFGTIAPILLDNLSKLKRSSSNSFESFLKYKNAEQYNNDLIMQYPRRIPRAFPKGKIINVPIIFNNSVAEYPDVYSDLQYIIQKKSIQYRDENLHEVFKSVNDSKLVICDNFTFIISKSGSIAILEYKKLKPVKINSNNITFVDNKIIFECKSEQDAKAIAKRVNSFIMKIKLSEQAV